MAQSVHNSLLNSHFATDSTLLAFGQASRSTGGINRRNSLLGVAQSIHTISRIAVTTIATSVSGVASSGTGRIGHNHFIVMAGGINGYRIGVIRVILTSVSGFTLFSTGGILRHTFVIVARRGNSHFLAAQLSLTVRDRAVHHGVVAAASLTGGRNLVLLDGFSISVARRRNSLGLAAQLSITDSAVHHVVVAAVSSTSGRNLILLDGFSIGVARRRNHSLRNSIYTANGTLLAFRQTRNGTGGIIALKGCFRMAQSIDSRLRNQHFLTDRTVATFGQASRGTSGINFRVGHRGVAKLRDFLVFGGVFTIRTLLVGLPANFRTSGRLSFDLLHAVADRGFARLSIAVTTSRTGIGEETILRASRLCITSRFMLMAQRSDRLLCSEHCLTDRAVAAFGQAGRGTSGRNRHIGQRSVTKGLHQQSVTHGTHLGSGTGCRSTGGVARASDRLITGSTGVFITRKLAVGDGVGLGAGLIDSTVIIGTLDRAAVFIGTIVLHVDFVNPTAKLMRRAGCLHFTAVNTHNIICVGCLGRLGAGIAKVPDTIKVVVSARHTSRFGILGSSRTDLQIILQLGRRNINCNVGTTLLYQLIRLRNIAFTDGNLHTFFTDNCRTTGGSVNVACSCLQGTVSTHFDRCVDKVGFRAGIFLARSIFNRNKLTVAVAVTENVCTPLICIVNEDIRRFVSIVGFCCLADRVALNNDLHTGHEGNILTQ